MSETDESIDMENIFRSLPGPVPSAFPTFNEVRRDAHQCATHLFNDVDTLKKIVERHEEKIRIRWGKKSKPQKKKLLLDAWPNMSTHHRPDVEAWLQDAKTEASYMWPSINLEDLMKSKTMLLFLHFRGRYHPREFVHSDLEQARLGEATGATTRAYLGECTMYFHRGNTAHEYGELVSWDDDDAAYVNTLNGIGMDPGHGLQALEIQQRIWAFLLKWSKSLLQDVSPLTEGEILPNPGPPPALADITSLQTIALEAPYRIPPHLVFARLESLASAERNAREDHLWALREDPGYFAEIMQETSEHLDTGGHKNSTLKEPGRRLFWNYILGFVLKEAHFMYATFDEIVKQIRNLARLHAEYRDQITPEASPPPNFVLAFQNLCYLLDVAKLYLIHNLQVSLFQSQIRKCGARQNHAIRSFLLFINMLTEDESLNPFTLHTVTNMIGHLMQTNSEVNALVSPWVAARLSSIAVVSECLHQLHLFKPWSKKIEGEMKINDEIVRNNYQESTKDWLPLFKTSFKGSQVYQYGDPTDGKFDYPVQRRRNEQNVRIMRKAEANLDAFWKAVDQHYKSIGVERSPLDLVAHLFSNDRTIRRTPEWVKPEHGKASVRKEQYVHQPFSPVYHDVTKQITGKFDRTSLLEKASKEKTRGDTVENNGAEFMIVHEVHNTPTIFNVNKRAHKVFKTLFHCRDNQDAPGEIPWADFLHSMVSLGFSAEKMHGSAWNFVPKTVDVGVGRSIQFHEPHPSNKIPFFWARRIGRRLGRAYGWDADTFQLA